jgi:formylglycine-generating enzyme required for sulfatase activity
MSDIFLSYASEDRSRAERLAEALQARGWSVWWNWGWSIPVAFSRVVEQALKDAKCMVVLWSRHSLVNDWLLTKAAEAQRRGVLISVRLDNLVVVPQEFGRLQIVSLVEWQSGEPHAGFDRLVDEIARVLGAQRSEKAPEKPGRQSTTVRAEAPTGEERGRGPQWRSWIGRGVRIVAFATGLTILVLGAWALARWGLDELTASATVTRDSSLCEAVPGFGPEMIHVEGATFQMGAAAGSADSVQQPAHTVTVKPFAVGTCEVTFEEYDRFAQATKRSLPEDYGWGRGRRPVMNLSWQDARDYAAWLSKETGKRYRLPTEAEWEYAARSRGKKEVWAGTSDEKQLTEYGVYYVNSPSRTQPVGSKKPNGLGLYDLSGNVWEWVEDCWHENYQGASTDGSARRQPDGGDCGARVIRGGSWLNAPEDLRASARDRGPADSRSGGIGFRLVQDVTE